MLLRPMDCSPSGSSVHVTSQARILEGVVIFYCRGSSPPQVEPMSPALAGEFFTLIHQGTTNICTLIT